MGGFRKEMGIPKSPWVSIPKLSSTSCSRGFRGYPHFRRPPTRSTEHMLQLWQHHHGKLRENMENTSCLLEMYGEMRGYMEKVNFCFDSMENELEIR